MTSGAESLMCEMLHCTSADLKLLDHVKYNWGDVLHHCDSLAFPGDAKKDLNDILTSIIDIGICNIENALQECRNELKHFYQAGELNEERENKLRLFNFLSPDIDISICCDGLDSHVRFERNGYIYRMYLKKALNEFRNNTGFTIEGFEIEDGAEQHVDSCLNDVASDMPVEEGVPADPPVPDELITGQIRTPRGWFYVTNMTREQMESAGYGYHHQSEDGKYLIMANGTRAFAIVNEQRKK